MNSEKYANAKYFVINYFNTLENKVDISAEKCSISNSDYKIDQSRENFLKIINKTRQNILKNLSTLLSVWNDEDSLESIVFKEEYLIFLEPIYECDFGKCLGKLIKFNYYLSNKILNEFKHFLQQIREEGYFTIEKLNEDVLHAYLLIQEIDPLIEDPEFNQKVDNIKNNSWINDNLHEFKLLNIINCHKIEFQFFQIKHINNSTFSEVKNLTELSLTNCGLEQFDGKFLSNISSLKTLNLSFNQLSSLQSNIFGSLINLEELILCGCSLSFIDKECFKNLFRIKLLDLSKNLLNQVESVWFKDMANLQVLYLNSNKIEILEDDVFKFLNNLRYLNISKNRIENIEAKVFSNLQSLNEICYDFFFDLKSILGDSFKHVKYHPSQNNVM